MTRSAKSIVLLAVTLAASTGYFFLKVDREEALSEAWDRMDGKDPDAEELQRQFEVQEREQQVAAELEALKQRVSE